MNLKAGGYSALFLLLAMLSTGYLHTEEPNPIQTMTFPDLAPTLYTLSTGEDTDCQLAYQLPDNYVEGQTYPVFLFLPGGTGGPNANGGLAVARSITKGKDYITVSMPLFRKGSLDPEEPYGGIYIGQDDFEVISKAYQTMLAKFFSEEPAAQTTDNVMGGFSNGGHSIAALISGGDDVITKHFQSFFLVDGGFFLNGLHRSSMKNLRFLALCGDTGEHWARPIVVDNFRNLQTMGTNYGVDFELITMEGIGHAFPDSYYQAILEWAKQEPTTE